LKAPLLTSTFERYSLTKNIWADLLAVLKICNQHFCPRLGVFGFLYQDTGNSDSSLGNFGIWDQVEALTWVKKHIRDFGGDPYQVLL